MRLFGICVGSHPPTGQMTLDTIPESPNVQSRNHNDVDPLLAPSDGVHMQGNHDDRMPGINEADSDFNMFGENAENSGGDIAALPMNTDYDDSSPQNESDAEEQTLFLESSNCVFLSNVGSSTAVSSPELSASSCDMIAQSFSDDSTFSSCTSQDVCNSSLRFMLDLPSDVKNRGTSGDRLYNPTSSEDEILERSLLPNDSEECESEGMDTTEAGAAQGGRIDEIPEASPQSEPGTEEHTHFPNSRNGGFLSNETSSVYIGSSGESSPEVCSGVASVPAYRLYVGSDSTLDQSVWERSGARPPMQWFPVLPSGPDVPGIENTFLTRHSEDWGLLESLHQESEGRVWCNDSSLPGVEPYSYDCQVVSWPVLPMGGDGSAFAEPLNGYTGLLPYRISSHVYQPSASTVDPSLADPENFRLPSVARSDGPNNGVLLEAESSGARQYALGNTGSNSLSATGDQQVTNASTLPAEPPDLEHGVHNLCVLVEQLMETRREDLEEQRERERRDMETRESEEANRQQANPLQVVYWPLPCTIQSLDSNHNSEPEFWQDVARARARIEQQNGETARAIIEARGRRWCTCASGVVHVSYSSFVFFRVRQVLTAIYKATFHLSRPTSTSCGTSAGLLLTILLSRHIFPFSFCLVFALSNCFNLWGNVLVMYFFVSIAPCLD